MTPTECPERMRLLDLEAISLKFLISNQISTLGSCSRKDSTATHTTFLYFQARFTIRVRYPQCSLPLLHGDGPG